MVNKALSTATVSITPDDSYSRVGEKRPAGISLTNANITTENPIQNGRMGQSERAFSAASTFLSGIMAISASQFIGAPLKMVDTKFYDAYMAWTKESFAVLVTTITQWWSPTLVRVSGDASMKGQLFQMQDGTLRCNFPHRLVLMANHQLYTDWLYLWWIAYTNKMHGHIYIILKESLKQLPIFGWGAQFYNFIFLSRKWDTDRSRFKSALSSLSNTDPMWLLIFPEGTNLSAVTKEKSAAWAKKTGVPDMKHQLLPRTTGMQFCLQELKQTTNWLYDCTIAYEGIPPGQYGQDIYTLRSSFLEGRPPKSVNMYWRRFKISEIPIDNDEAFGRWLTNRWREKDYILEYFYKYTQFPAEDALKALTAAGSKRQPKHAKAIEANLKGGGWDEFLSIFGPLNSAAGMLSSVDLTEPINFEALLAKIAMQQQFSLLNMNNTALAATSQEVVKKALAAAQQSKAIPDSVLQYLMKSPLQTQEQMKRAITASANKSGHTAIAKRTGQAPAAKKIIPANTQRKVAQAVEQTQQMLSKPAQPKPKTISRPATNAQKTILARYVTSQGPKPQAVAVSTPTNAAKKPAATSTKKIVANSQVKKPPAAPSIASAPVARKPVKLNSAMGGRRQSMIDLPVPKPAAKMKPSASSNPGGPPKIGIAKKI